MKTRYLHHKALDRQTIDRV